MLVLSEAEREFIQGGIDQNVRADGRGNLNSRSLVLESGIVSQVSFALFHHTQEELRTSWTNFCHFLKNRPADLRE